MGKSKLYLGNEPKGAILIGENSGWSVFDLRKQNGEWILVKLISKVAREKGNYRLAWSKSQHRFARGGDAALLIGNRPEVHEWLECVMKGV
jgi:hypothetical protein